MKTQCLTNFQLQPLSEAWPTLNRWADLRLDGVLPRNNIVAVADKERGLCFDIPRPREYQRFLQNGSQGGGFLATKNDFQLLPRDEYFVAGQEYIRLDYTNDALANLAQLGGVNRGDLERAAEKYPDLAANWINVWLRDYDSINKNRKNLLELNEVKNLVRCYGPTPEMLGKSDGVLRAVRSDAFNISIDAPDLISILCGILSQKKQRGDWDNVQVSVSANDRYCYIVIDNRDMALATATGKKIGASCVIRTSDVGYSSLVIEERALVFACMNGMIIGEPVRKAHLGKRQGDGFQYSNRTKNLQSATMLSELGDVLENVFDRERFTNFINKQSENEKIIVAEKEESQIFSCIQENMGITEDVRNRLVSQFLAEQNPDGSLNRTKDGVVQAITQIGRQIAVGESYEKALPFEAMGGKISMMDNEIFNSLQTVSVKRGAAMIDKVVLRSMN